MKQFEYKIYSQNGEDGIISEIFNRIGTTNKFFVEFGVQDGKECNTRLLRERGWSGIWMDCGYESSNISKRFIDAKNVNDTFAEMGVPQELDLLSIDIDGQDFYVWDALKYNPRVVVIEINGGFPPDEIQVVQYDLNFKWDGSTYIGGSLLAIKTLGELKGYRLIYTEKRGVNAFFVQEQYDSLFPDKEYLKQSVPLAQICHYPDPHQRKLVNPFEDVECRDLIHNNYNK